MSCSLVEMMNIVKIFQARGLERWDFSWWVVGAMRCTPQACRTFQIYVAVTVHIEVNLVDPNEVWVYTVSLYRSNRVEPIGVGPSHTGALLLKMFIAVKPGVQEELTWLMAACRVPVTSRSSCANDSVRWRSACRNVQIFNTRLTFRCGQV
jgi:hypothetical protein